VTGRAVRPRAALAVAALLFGIAGCGGGQSAPVDQQPKLATLLAAVDDAIVAGHYRQARASLDDLVKAASARGAGALDSSSADRVLATAAQLMTQLRTTIQERRAEVTPDEPTSTDEGDQGDGGDESHGNGNANGHHKHDHNHGG
jgi:hypothetical protein